MNSYVHIYVLYWLEVESQVSGDDDDVHEVDDKVMLTSVQILVNVQILKHKTITTFRNKIGYKDIWAWPLIQQVWYKYHCTPWNQQRKD